MYNLQSALVQSTAVFSDCQTTNSAKQLSTRLSSFQGLFELAGTIGAAYVKNSQSPGNSVLYEAFSDLKAATDCST